MATHAMTAADAAWFHMDRPTNLMVINSVLVFDEPLDWPRVKRTYIERIIERFPRFTQRVAEGRPLGRPHWEDVPGFKPASHMHRRTLPAPHDEAALQELVGRLVTKPLDHSKPLWQVYLIDGFGDGCALLVRMHHCIADGIALARVMLLLTDEDAEAGIESERVPAIARRRSVPLPSPARDVLSGARLISGTAAHQGMEALAHPRHLIELAERAAVDAVDFAQLIAPGRDARSPFKGPLGVENRVAWSQPVPLERVKAIGRPSGATVNDVLVAAVSGALGRYMDSHGSHPVEVHAMVPFNLRPLDVPLPRDLGNRFGLLLLQLPVGIRDARNRLGEVKRLMDGIKHSDQGPMSFGILDAIGRAPMRVEELLIDFFTAKSTLVLTNVPGPRRPVYLAGVPVRSVIVWAPCSGSLGMTVSVFSYDGRVTVGFLTDAGLVPNPYELVDALGDELDELYRRRLPRRPARRRAHGHTAAG
jgi:WS/DGAT/MGAT family acyltransferase